MPQPEGQGCGLATVLVVEDDAELREVICYSLTDALGVRCVEAIDAPQAMMMLCQFTAENGVPDCVVLDILMPGAQDGWDVLESIRGNPLWAPTPVIVLSGKATLRAERERAARLGAVHMEKTARFLDKLVDRVAEELGGQ